MDAFEAAQRAIDRTDPPGRATMRLGTVTFGHPCTTCGGHDVEAADLLRIDQAGASTVAVFYHCPNCQPKDAA